MEKRAMLLAHLAKHSAEADLNAAAELYCCGAEQVRSQIKPPRRVTAGGDELSPPV